MIRNLKALGLALCAVFALSAVAASAASAQDVKTDLFTAAANPTHLTGIQVGTKEDNVFGTKGSAATVNCEEAIYKGTTGLSAESVTVTPEYKKCTAGGIGASVDDNGCNFILTGTTDTYFDTNNVHKGEDATVSLECNHTGNLKITAAFGCVITFADTSGGNTVNQNLLGAKYTNEVSGGIWDVKVDATVDKIHYTSAGCGFLGLPATGNDGFLTETVTVKGYSDAAHTKQVNLTWS